MKGANTGVKKYHANFRLVLNSTVSGTKDLLIIVPVEKQLILYPEGVVKVNDIP